MRSVDASTPHERQALSEISPRLSVSIHVALETTRGLADDPGTEVVLPQLGENLPQQLLHTLRALRLHAGRPFLVLEGVGGSRRVPCIALAKTSSSARGLLGITSL